MVPFAIYLYGPATGPLAIGFEQAAEKLSAMDRLHVEMDGAFLWRGLWRGTSWHVEGMMYDAGDRVQYVELKGFCPLEAWQRLLAVFSGESGAASIVRIPDGQRLSGPECLSGPQFEEETWGKSDQTDSLA